MKNFGVLLICTMIITVGDYFRKTPEVQPYVEPKIMNEHIIERERVRDSIYQRIKETTRENTLELNKIKKRIANLKNNN